MLFIATGARFRRTVSGHRLVLFNGAERLQDRRREARWTSGIVKMTLPGGTCFLSKVSVSPGISSAATVLL